jgi:hypothetical protein
LNRQRAPDHFRLFPNADQTQAFVPLLGLHPHDIEGLAVVGDFQVDE